MDINSLGSTYLNNITSKASSADSSIDKTLKSNMSNSTDDELMDVCKEFEAYFVEQIFKNMEKALVPESESTDGANATLVDFYKGKLLTEYSSMAADQSNTGLAQMLYEQMKRNYGTTDIPSVEETNTDTNTDTTTAQSAVAGVEEV